MGVALGSLCNQVSGFVRSVSNTLFGDDGSVELSDLDLERDDPALEKVCNNMASVGQQIWGDMTV